MEDLIVGYQGIAGSYSEQALVSYFSNNVTKINVKEFRDVFKGVANGHFKYGVLPIENSSTGGVIEVYDLIREYGCSIVGERCIKISHSLLGISGSSVETVKEIYSHPQALKQCETFIKELKGVKIIPTLNTALSAKYVRDENDVTKLAIGSNRCSELYGLDELRKDINYNKKNFTRFIIISKDKKFDDSSDKVSILFSTDHQPGALFNVLSYFAKSGLNLLRIESRPMIESTWEYFFYIDFEGNINEEKTEKVLSKLIDETSYFHMLGNYKRCVEY